jgi:hypothetical protein
MNSVGSDLFLHGRMYKIDSACPNTTTVVSKLLDMYEVRLFRILYYNLGTSHSYDIRSPYANTLPQST